MTTKAIEVLCTRWAKMADGGVSIGLRVHFDDAKSVGDMKPNRRYAASFVEIGDDEQPVPPPTEEDIQHGTAPAIESLTATVPSRAHSKRLTKQAGRLCNSPSGRLFLEESYRSCIPNGCKINTLQEAKELIYFICRITSLTQIIPGTPAAQGWEAVYARYLAWERCLPEPA